MKTYIFIGKVYGNHPIQEFATTIKTDKVRSLAATKDHFAELVIDKLKTTPTELTVVVTEILVSNIEQTMDNAVTYTKVSKSNERMVIKISNKLKVV